MFTKILVPLNGSDVAEHALTPALALAKAYEGTLILLCTCTTKLAHDPLQDLAKGYDWIWPEHSDEAVEIEEESYLNELMGRHLVEPGVKIQSLFVRGDEAGAIIGIAEAQDIDLIVMTKHCRSGALYSQLGDITERVLHHASCSVMVICSNFPDGGATVAKDVQQYTDRTSGRAHA